MTAGPITDLARTVEEAGFDGLSFTEHPAPSARWLDAGGHQTLDPFVALSAAAAVTYRIRLVTYLSVATYRNPFLLGKSAASIDLISAGRFTLGLGAGYQKSEFTALGVDFDRRNELFDDALEVLPRYWSGEPVEFEGSTFEARDVVCAPIPVQQPIPIWIGGNSRVTMRRVAARCQGWMPMLVDETIAATTRTAHIPDITALGERIAELRTMAGDRTDPIEVLVTYPDTRIADVSSPTEEHVERLAQMEEVGVTWVSIPVRAQSHEWTCRSIEWLGDTYL